MRRRVASASAALAWGPGKSTLANVARTGTTRGLVVEPKRYSDADQAHDLKVEIKTIRSDAPFRLMSDSNVEIPAQAVQIKYASVGDPSKPTVFVCPSMSNSVHIVDGEETLEDGRVVKHSGWWRGVVGHGPSFGIDLDQFHVLVGAPMGSPFGSTSPLAPEDSPLKGVNFPQITPLDQAAHQKLLLDQLGISKVFAVVGGSMGGMQALQFAANFPEMYDVFCAVAATAQTSPGTVALRSVQRKAVRTDPAFMGGNYDVNPTEGMAIARMFGTICYRSPAEFDGRFDWEPTLLEHGEASFEVERYLQHQANKFTKSVNYDANCYLLLSEAMDRMNIGDHCESFEKGASRIPTSKQGLLLSYSTDRLTPAKDLQRLASVLGSANVPVHFEVLDSPFGHDAFLIKKQAQQLNIRLGAFLNAKQSQNVSTVNRLVKEMYEH